MRILLDTHLLIWLASDRAKAGAAAVALVGDRSVDVAFSTVSIWEIAVKRALNRPDFMFDPREIRDGCLHNDIVELEITSAHGISAGELPLIHRDPFDRLLLAQARIEDRTLLTRDDLLAKYDVPVRLV